MTEESTAAAAVADEPSRKRAKKKKSHPVAKTNSRTTFASIRVPQETCASVNKLAAQIQLKTGEKTSAGDAVAFAIEKVLKG